MLRKALVLAALAAMPASACMLTSSPTLCLDPSFTSKERDEVQVAIDRWHDASKGRVNLEISCDAHPPNVHRVDSSYPGLAALDENLHAKALGITTSKTREIYIVWDRVTDDNFLPVIQHELGHYVNLRWPECSAPRDCVHVPAESGPAIMTAYQSGAVDFTDADLAFCRASGVCP